MISQLIITMPKSYQAVTTLIDVIFSQTHQAVTIEFVKNKLIQEEIETGQTGMQEDVSFYASGSTRQGKWSNLQSYNKPNSSKTPTDFPFKCNVCGVRGYKKVDCLNRSPWSQESGLPESESCGAVRIVKNGVTCIEGEKLGNIGKITRTSFKPIPDYKKATRFLEIMSSDAAGPITP
ncbi:hypothetical protein PR048_023899, partial [Dryococelus australis]